MYKIYALKDLLKLKLLTFNFKKIKIKKFVKYLLYNAHYLDNKIIIKEKKIFFINYVLFN